jgi:hypothetical protein
MFSYLSRERKEAVAQYNEESTSVNPVGNGTV